jgi:hypothetical protein
LVIVGTFIVLLGSGLDTKLSHAIYIKFTKLGDAVLNHFLKELENFHSQYDSYLSTLDKDDYTVINRFLRRALAITENIANK